MGQLPPAMGGRSGGGSSDGGEPEIFSPRHASGHVTPVSKLGGSTHHHSYQIDARGAQFGVENRVSRAIEAAHSSAISGSVRANAEPCQAHTEAEQLS